MKKLMTISLLTFLFASTAIAFDIDESITLPEKSQSKRILHFEDWPKSLLRPLKP